VYYKGRVKKKQRQQIARPEGQNRGPDRGEVQKGNGSGGPRQRIILGPAIRRGKITGGPRGKMFKGWREVGRVEKKTMIGN